MLKLTFPQFTRLKKLRAPIVGLLSMLLILGLFNAQLVAGRVAALTQQRDAYAAIPPAPTYITPDNKVVNNNPQLIIPQIKVEAPIVTNMPSAVEKDVQKSLEYGVLLFAGSPPPGGGGNTVIIGHSSNTPWAPGDYKFVFMLLDKLKTGDHIFVNYEGVQFTYEVREMSVVSPHDTSVLLRGDTPMLTLITCTPVGTTINRLIVRAEQISPAPSPENTQQSTRVPRAMALPSGAQNAFQATKELFQE